MILHKKEQTARKCRKRGRTDTTMLIIFGHVFVCGLEFSISSFGFSNLDEFDKFSHRQGIATVVNTFQYKGCTHTGHTKRDEFSHLN